MVWPVTNPDDSDARKIAAPTNSSTRPIRPMGVFADIAAFRSGRRTTCEFSGVRKNPGAIAFTRILCLAHSLARLSVNILTPALLHEYGATSLKLTKLVREQVLMMQPLCCLIIWRRS